MNYNLVLNHKLIHMNIQQNVNNRRNYGLQICIELQNNNDGQSVNNDRNGEL